MSPRIRTICVEPPNFAVGRVKTVTSTRFEEFWKEDRIVSQWYFLTKKGKRVYLKIGWNLFGRKRYNNIRIRETTMRGCELTVFIPDPGKEVPSIHNLSGNCIVDGVRMTDDAVTLYHQTAVGIYVEQKNKLVVLRFYDANEENDQQTTAEK